MPRGKRIDAVWLSEHYPVMSNVNSLLDEYEREFAWRPTKGSLYQRAWNLGLRKLPEHNRNGKAQRMVRWSKEPELTAWMLAHDHGQRIDAVQEEFREAFGFTLSRGQVNQFRASHGRKVRPSHNGGKPRVPVGTERVSKNGYIVVKVRDVASVPMSKDNWKLKHVLMWEQANGPLPKGYRVYFADHDQHNFNPDNLVAVPGHLVGLLNQADAPEWHDRESLLSCIALGELKHEARRIEHTAPRTCGVCGRTFRPKEPSSSPKPRQTCPECLAAGHKSAGIRERKGKEA